MTPAGKWAFDMARHGYRMWSRHEPVAPTGCVSATYGRGCWVEGLFGWDWVWADNADQRLIPVVFPADLAGKTSRQAVA